MHCRDGIEWVDCARLRNGHNVLVGTIAYADPRVWKRAGTEAACVGGIEIHVLGRREMFHFHQLVPALVATLASDCLPYGPIRSIGCVPAGLKVV